MREVEEVSYEALHKDYSESIDTLGRAIADLKEHSPDKKNVETVLMQYKKLKCTRQTHRDMVDAYLRDERDEFEDVHVLEQLHKLYIAERTTAETDESRRVFVYQRNTAMWAAEILMAEMMLDEAEVLEATRNNEDDLKDTTGENTKSKAA
jgi:hypothetical protein